MNDQFNSETRRQEISALMDGELGQDRAQFALKCIADDCAVAAQWGRLHLLRHYLREAEVQPIDNSFLVRLQQRIQLEAGSHQSASQAEQVPGFAAAVRAQASRASRGVTAGWRQQMAGLAIAASVAALALFGFNSLVLQPGEVLPGSGGAVETLLVNNQDSAAAAAASESFAPRSNALQDQFNARAIPVNYTEDSVLFRQQINNYMLRHSQLASGSGRVGFTAYAPLLSKDVDLIVEQQPAVAQDDYMQMIDVQQPSISIDAK